MVATEFVHAVNELEGAKLVYSSDNGFAIEGRNEAGVPCTYVLTRNDVQQTNWDECRDVLLGQRPAKIIDHYTRVVGYYSSIRNWNRSKIAELKDRQKGDYEVH